jgi:[ribosomal protein S18]-alanine N-acetyltransferase
VLQVRAMTPADLQAVMRLQTATPEAPHWKQEIYEGFLAEGNLPGQVFVAKAGCLLAGFVAARIAVDVCELESIVVDTQVRRAGVGKALLARLREWARSHHASRVELEVRSKNNSALTFYEHAGFHRNGLRRGYYRNPDDDAVLMSLRLESEPVQELGSGKLS